MSKTKTTTEKIESIKLKIQQLENERKRILQVQKESDRKARTRRLIERGAILESLVSGSSDFTNDQIKSFLEKTVQSDYARKILDELLRQSCITATEKSPWEVKSNGTGDYGKKRGCGGWGLTAPFPFVRMAHYPSRYIIQVKRRQGLKKACRQKIYSDNKRLFIRPLYTLITAKAE